MELLYYPDPRLREVAQPVPQVDDDVRSRAREMIEIMHSHGGIGLAATQVGWNGRVIVVADPEHPEAKSGTELVLVNPKIVESSGTMESEEGCLSLPGIYGQITRAARVIVDALGLDGKPVRIEASELAAAVLQHEVDHLDGILFITRLSVADRQRTKKQLRELEEKFRAAHA